MLASKEIMVDENAKLGEGNFGTVYKGSVHGTIFAVKKLHAKNLPEKLVDEFRTEVKLMTQLNTHPYLLGLAGACFEPDNFMIVTELLDYSLYDLIHKHKQSEPTTLVERLQLAVDAVRGMCWLHRESHTILHKDLKSPNILVKKYGQHRRALVADFGLSELAKPDDDDLSSSQVQSSNKFVTSPIWTAPEIMEEKEFTRAADVYSFGIILWELVTGELPWRSATNERIIFQVSVRGDRPPLPDDIPTILHDIITQAWHQDPEKRPTFAQLLPRLEDAIFACEINHAVGGAFWKASFKDADQVDYEQFEKAFVQYFFESGKFEGAQLVLNCLKAVVIDHDVSSPSSPKVSIESFSDCLAYFGGVGQLEKRTDGLKFLQGIVSLLKVPYFHGEQTQAQAESLLAPHKPGTFLVRYSSDLGFFSISFIDKKGEFKHSRIGNIKLVNTTLPSFLRSPKAKSGAYYMKKPAPGSPYLKLFQSQQQSSTISASPYGYHLGQELTQ